VALMKVGISSYMTMGRAPYVPNNIRSAIKDARDGAGRPRPCAMAQALAQNLVEEGLARLLDNAAAARWSIHGPQPLNMVADACVPYS